MKVVKMSRQDLFSLEEQYIFHGSSILFSIGKPNQAKCNTKNPLKEKSNEKRKSSLP